MVKSSSDVNAHTLIYCLLHLNSMLQLGQSLQMLNRSNDLYFSTIPFLSNCLLLCALPRSSHFIGTLSSHHSPAILLISH